VTVSITLGTVAVVLLAAGGLLAATDAALSARSRTEVRDLAAERGPGRIAAMLRRIADDLDAHRSSVNFLRVVTETTAAVMVTLAFSLVLQDWPMTLLVSALIMILVSFVLVGASPRSVGRTHADFLLQLTAPLVRFLRVIIGPFAVTLVGLADRVTPGRVRASTLSSEEQLLNLVDEAVEQSVLEQDDRELIHSVFAFGDTILREVMVPRTDMVVVEVEDTLATALDKSFSAGVSRLPVIGQDIDDVLGVVTLREISRHVLKRGGDLATSTVRSVLRPAVFLPELQKADEALRALQRQSAQIALVVDEYGGIAGLVTLEDLIEELVGEIGDESDRGETEAEPLEDGRWRVRARMPLDDLGALFDLDVDDEDVESVGGLLGKALGALPQPGDSAAVAGLILTAERIGRQRRLLTVIAQRDPDAPGDPDEDDRPSRRRGVSPVTAELPVQHLEESDD